MAARKTKARKKGSTALAVVPLSAGNVTLGPVRRVKKKRTKAAESKIAMTAHAVKEVLTAVPVYKDALQPGSKELGTSLALLMATVAALVGAGTGWLATDKSGETFKAGFQRRMQAKLARLDPDSLAPAPARVAGPLLAHYPFVADDTELRDLFENLLASAMKPNSNAHPAFVEVLKQMTPDEARLVRALSDLVREIGAGAFPYVRMKAQAPIAPDGKRQGYTSVGFVCELDFVEGLDNPKRLSAAIDNLERLKLIEIDMHRYAANAELYNALETSASATEARTILEKRGETLAFDRGIWSVTSFGLEFLSSVTSHTRISE